MFALVRGLRVLAQPFVNNVTSVFIGMSKSRQTDGCWQENLLLTLLNLNIGIKCTTNCVFFTHSLHLALILWPSCPSAVCVYV